MTTATTTPAPPRRTPFRRGRHAVAVTAAAVALVSVAALLTLLLTTMAGAHPWTGLTWITMIGLPIAFLLGVVLVVDAIRARRTAAGRRGRP